MKRHPQPTRRTALGRIAVLAIPALLAGRTARSAELLRLTPAQTEGPFYPVELPADTDFDLLRQGDLRYPRGQPSWLDGTVRDLEGRPVRGASVEIWQCDADGHYSHPRDGGRADPAFQSFGRVAVDAQGRFRFHTIRPVAYSGRTPHIHVKVRLAQRTLLTTQLYVEGDPGNDRDPLWRSLRDPLDRAALTVPFTPAADGLRAAFPIVVAA
ncbi:protocatechuate 3,4-dioxygenase [Rhizobacter sp. Root404]|uniref:dioxygenase family protein n=1 Tax=Rhizobacter sp. Root404 TaxID=1736528 RepID=UPI000B00FF06|nr:protocatechuate 3,4-dioxygenase [Rhizobacter sp. Root404]